MNTTSTKSNRGGKRPGAGRPKRSTPAKTISVRIDADLVDAFRAHCSDVGRSQAEQIAKWIGEIETRWADKETESGAHGVFIPAEYQDSGEPIKTP